MKTQTVDGTLDTEDKNNNNILDFDPSRNSSEDIGFEFNPSGVYPICYRDRNRPGLEQLYNRRRHTEH